MGVTYNVLSPALSAPSSHLRCDEDDLHPPERLDKIKKKILTQVIEKKAICCLQEVGLSWKSDLLQLFDDNEYTVIDTHYGTPSNDYMGLVIAYPFYLYKCHSSRVERLAESYIDYESPDFYPDDSDKLSAAPSHSFGVTGDFGITGVFSFILSKFKRTDTSDPSMTASSESGSEKGGCESNGKGYKYYKGGKDGSKDAKGGKGGPWSEKDIGGGKSGFVKGGFRNSGKEGTSFKGSKCEKGSKGPGKGGKGNDQKTSTDKEGEVDKFKPKDLKTCVKDDFIKFLTSLKAWWRNEVRTESSWEIAERRMNRVLMCRFHRVENHDDIFAVANYHNPCLFGNEEKVRALALHTTWLVQSFQEFAGDQCPRILCGDFNFTPTNSRIYEYVTTANDELLSHPPSIKHLKCASEEGSVSDARGTLVSDTGAPDLQNMALSFMDGRPDRYKLFTPEFIPMDSAYAVFNNSARKKVESDLTVARNNAANQKQEEKTKNHSTPGESSTTASESCAVSQKEEKEKSATSGTISLGAWGAWGGDEENASDDTDVNYIAQVKTLESQLEK